MLDYRTLLLSAMLLFLVGCDPEAPIQSYTRPREQPAPFEKAPKFMIWGAIFPEDKPIWFFKVTGFKQDIEPYFPLLQSFLQSIRFSNGLSSPPLYDLPGDWQEIEGDEFVFRRIVFGTKDRPLIMTISKASGSMQDNLVRWSRQQLGMTDEQFLDEKNYKFPVKSQDGFAGIHVRMLGPNYPSR